MFNLTNKNTGDFSGDASFVLSRKDIALECRKDPTNPRCFFNGDEPGSTDLIIEYQVEIDGQWGPYEFCNPVHNDDAEAGFSCRADMSGVSPGHHSQPACACPRMNVTVGRWNRSAGGGWMAPPAPAPAPQLGAAFDRCSFAGRSCGECTGSTGDSGYHCLWCENSRTCHSWDQKPAAGCGRDECIRDPVGAHSNCSTVATPQNCPGARPPSPPHHGGGSEFGTWYSHPANGECRDGHYVGDGSGCSWREVRAVRAINATCMYARLDANVEAHDPQCFQRCPQPLNHTSDCYDECYDEAVRGMNNSALTRPWLDAFSSEDPAAGGCSTVQLPSV